jgi:tetratricopeptide (TPR) repeat protein
MFRKLLKSIHAVTHGRIAFRSVFSALLLTAVSAFAGNPAEFESANQLYDRGKFAEAKQAYESLVKTHNYSANLFFNLGNTEYRLGNPARAILDYERALALQPSHEQANANLALVRRETNAKIEGRPWFDFAFPEFSESFFVSLAAAGAWLFAFSILAICLRWRGAVALPWFAAAAGLILAAYASFGVFETEQKNSGAIVIGKLADARLAPAEGSPALQSLPAGSRLHVLGERGLWDYCALPGGEHGWISAKAIERIRPQAL